MNNLLQKLKMLKSQQPKLAALSLQKRDQILKNLSALLLRHRKQILKANVLDLKNLKRKGMKDRLVLNEKRLTAMAGGLTKVANLPDPLNKVLEKKKLKNGLQIFKISAPLGVVGVIYESRPNVTVDIAGLGIKSGNALVLKGGSEAKSSNKILVDLIHQALKTNGLPLDLVYLINPKENWQKVLLNARGLVDVLIPRGGKGLIRWVRENSKIPIIETGAGVCHTFADADCNIGIAAKIIVNAKTQRPGVCNALDTLVIHQTSAKKLLPALAAPLAKWRVEIFADPDSYRALKKIYPQELLHPSRHKHYGKEFLSLKMAIKAVKDFEEGLKFIKKYTSGHSEAILSRDADHINKFLAEIDSAVVYANASTRFTDGGEFGMGAEVGVSTQKLHARGPMGLESLTSYKWIVKGNGQTRK